MAGSQNFDSSNTEFLRATLANNWTGPPATLSAWVKFPTAGSTQAVCAIADSSSSRRFALLKLSTDVMFASIRIGGGSTATFNGSISLSTNTWYHFALVSSSHTDHKMYLNGVEDGSSTTDTTGTDSFSYFRIGVYFNESSSP